MREYPHIDTIYKREPAGPRRGQIMEGEYASPELAYLAECHWVGSEKVDGMSCRILWDGARITFGGKTNNAQIPATLVSRLQMLFSDLDIFRTKFDADSTQVCLYGEGYGTRIQKGGGNYNPTGVDFVLFDVKVGPWWLERADIEDIAQHFGIQCVPIVFHGTLPDACAMTALGFQSQWGPFLAEGLVLKPQTTLLKRNGERVIAKIKYRDYFQLRRA